MVRVFIGFHGTSKASADMILLDKRFLPSNREDEWLGKGIYFFEDDPDQAIDWCVRARKYKEWAILKTVIEAQEVLDLTRKREWDMFLSIIKQLQGKMKQTKYKGKRLLNGVAINFICQQFPYEWLELFFLCPAGVIRTTLLIFPRYKFKYA
ncbi:hypothetical protein [Neomoorella humiferrea]|uniref:DUF3990 domain-containing protein n=1 Tax=Neomoorella humiferrea TaxID=676965 RepID=A0A2T0ANW8_9FIRM|nr:hypothetical protein [Moorella humiferrea]PRR70705.1 hypothetical protein MOHU_18120 [Moorella humiferrea]